MIPKTEYSHEVRGHMWTHFKTKSTCVGLFFVYKNTLGFLKQWSCILHDSQMKIFVVIVQVYVDPYRTRNYAF
jgi:hypothetical protein